ncbi:L-ribulose-5-phosphate 3-epimerase UlaE [Bifidobacterium commune]|uniref:TIM barrel protein n=1 Tax=Bifidobacterium commune TaxID=1505727 RepID=UPI000A693DB3|nr:hypothetical protein [Bifidobacterium commune]MBB2954659.1 L-ribulose-5-phosphate 3-epimerase UlaE [Bifidobacterium commune]
MKATSVWLVWDWTREQRKDLRDAAWDTSVRIHTLMLSGHRRYPLGSVNPQMREHSLEMLCKAIDLAYDLGIRNIRWPVMTSIMSSKRLNLVSGSWKT